MDRAHDPLGPAAGAPRVRVARARDVPELSRFFMEAWREAGQGAMGFAGADDRAMREISSREFLGKRLASPSVRMFIAEEGKRILGFASLRVDGPDSAELSGMVVLESRTHEGLGTRLLEKALRAAAGLGYGKMLVKTEAYNGRALGFYKKLGFVEKGKWSERVGRGMVPLRTLEKRILSPRRGRPRR